MTRWIAEEDLSQMLPTESFQKGYKLVWYNPEWMPCDPTILFLRGFEVYRWEYDPMMSEVWDKIKELDKANADWLQGVFNLVYGVEVKRICYKAKVSV